MASIFIPALILICRNLLLTKEAFRADYNAPLWSRTVCTSLSVSRGHKGQPSESPLFLRFQWCHGLTTWTMLNYSTSCPCSRSSAKRMTFTPSWTSSVDNSFTFTCSAAAGAHATVFQAALRITRLENRTGVWVKVFQPRKNPAMFGSHLLKALQTKVVNNSQSNPRQSLLSV